MKLCVSCFPGLRHLAHALLVGVDAKQAGSQPLQTHSSPPSGQQAYDTGAVQLAAGALSLFSCLNEP